MLGNYAFFSYGTALEIRLLNIIGSSVAVMLVFTLLLDITMLLVVQRHIPNNKYWKYRGLTQTASLILILISWGKTTSKIPGNVLLYYMFEFCFGPQIDPQGVPLDEK